MSKIGDTITLQKQNVEAIKCKKCHKLMVNIDADQVEKGDMTILKRLGILISNPETPDPVCINCEVEAKPTFREKISSWFASADDDDDDDSSLFGHGSFGGSSSGGGFGGGGFGGGGFGGGGFGGGGAGRGF